EDTQHDQQLDLRDLTTDLRHEGQIAQQVLRLIGSPHDGDQTGKDKQGTGGEEEVLRSRLLIRLASAIRCSRNSSRLIQSLRYRCSTLARQAVSLPRCQAYRVYPTQQNMNQQNANRFSQSDSAF